VNEILIKYFFLTLLSIGLTSFSIPSINQLGLKKGFIDKPNKRKHHEKSIVRIGGLSIAIGFFIPFLFSMFLGWFNTEELRNINLILLTSFCFFSLGFIEDILRVSMISRLLSQIIISCLVWGFGLQIKILDLSLIFPNFNSITLPNLISLFITVIWIVGVTNSFNWIDGLDGLSSGLAVISIVSFSILLLSFNEATLVLLMALLVGSCVGFLFFNFYPAKIFMGDGGSYLIGFLIALFSIYSYNFLLNIGVRQFVLLFQFLILFIPIVDMAYVFFSRIFESRSPFYPDRRHFHFRLQRLGFSHLESVLLSYLISVNFILFAFAGIYHRHLYVFLGSSLLIILIYCFFRNNKISFALKKVFKKLNSD
tara:strand:+ start:1385 stop:2485 length:1101 start_codon:yes stop_codon:yes gene_type:complete